MVPECGPWSEVNEWQLGSVSTVVSHMQLSLVLCL